MRVPLSWLREYAAVPEQTSAEQLAADLVRVGLEVEAVEHAGADVTGPVVVGRVLEFVPEPQKNGKTINWCRVDVGTHNDADFSDPAFTDGDGQPVVGGARGIVCGAHNFRAGDLVVVALPGSVLPGDFAIAARKTYGHVSDGMICSAAELGLGDDHAGIIVLPEPAGADLGQDAAPVLHLREDVLDIAVTPDRGYCWSVRGIAREASVATGAGWTDPVARDVPAAVDGGYPVRLESAACPLFVALSVDGLDPSAPSPRWLTRRLQLAGMRPISLAVDVTNYVMLETGQPLHAYDADLLGGPIVVRQAEPGEKLTTLDDVARVLDPADLVIADDSGPIGLAGVMGGQTTELRDTTTAVVIEAAHFDAMSIARTSRRHRLGSEASRRFERGVDPRATYAAAHRAAALLVELGGGRLRAGETIAGAVPGVPTQRIDVGLPGRVMGAPIDRDTVLAHLGAVGVGVEEDGDTLRLTPPSWRPDLRDPYDYVEEVGRLYGYERVQPVVPAAPVGRGLSPSQRGRRLVNAALTEAGFVEVVSFPFSSEQDLDRLGVPAGDPRRDLQRLANPLSETQPAMRTTLLPGLFAAVALNRSRSNDDLALFETGSVYFPDPERRVAPRPAVTGRPTDDELAAMDAAIGRQPRHLGAVLTGDWRPAGWTGPAEPAGWRHALAFARTAARALGAELEVEAAEQAPWHPGRCAALSVGGSLLGHAGELHPAVVAAYGLPARTAAVELDLTALLAAAPGRGEVVPVSPFPVVKEDVALVVDESVPAAAVGAALRAGAGELLESLRLFDVFTGPQIGEGRKSLAYALRFRAADRTLTDTETAAAREAAVARAAADVGAVQRS
ncbi:phenylalanyl-tRNA synthetase beta chain [Friedmanniella endophytica]|uniref:Phenylalanine--tRNA ligase beta subunit n=1 Tax=Microlunatus kandeliicorticis TaxID=1759536 RepID=A0A7W3IUC9_9ACTN|nr:phenylalanine--tRNA ligase subunit beta [Microlunatus kandeliicorticis]MBA8795295.1 phenylalanyl-tRNA synthetase beta chain [Microlunatus kandeliicorticis]